jgi:hypothetical protein
MATYEYVPETGTFVNTATDATTPVSAIGAGDTVDFPNIEPGTYDYTLPSNFTAASIHIGLGARIKVAPGGTLTAVVDISTGGHLLLNGQGTPVTFNGYAVGSPLATGLGTLGMVTINITADISSNILARIAQTITTNNRIYINTSVQVNVSSTVQNTGATLNLSDAPSVKLLSGSVINGGTLIPGPSSVAGGVSIPGVTVKGKLNVPNATYAFLSGATTGAPASATVQSSIGAGSGKIDPFGITLESGALF